MKKSMMVVRLVDKYLSTRKENIKQKIVVLTLIMIKRKMGYASCKILLEKHHRVHLELFTRAAAALSRSGHAVKIVARDCKKICCKVLKFATNASAPFRYTSLMTESSS
jgi:hypothetical protein